MNPVPASADTLWLNADVLTMNPARPRAAAIGTRAGRIVAVGSEHDVLRHGASSAVRHDLRGRCVLPGLIDTHAHPLLGGMRDLFEATVGLNASIDELLDAVRERAGTTLPGRWINGGPWHMARLERVSANPRALLDRVAPVHPVALSDATYHTLWVNSAALTACGITAATPDPQGGRIGRDPATGEPDGLLYEAACTPVRAATLPDARELRAALAYVRSSFHALGLVGFKDAEADEPLLAAYHAADLANELQLHAGMHIGRRPFFRPELVSYHELERLRDDHRSEHVHTGFVKLFIDGVAPMRTAAFLQPYLNCTGVHDPDALLLIAPATLAEEVTELDRRGFVVKMHAVGDRAVRAGLDAIQKAREANGHSGLRHEIAHSAFIDPADFGRFAALGAVAEMSPRLWYPNPVTAGQYSVLGPARTHRCHQIRSLLDAGAELTYGSDWPAAAADADPWIALAGMLTRRHPFGLFEGEVGADQAITLERALPLFTTQAARSLGVAHLTGSIEVGSSADFIVIDRPFAGLGPREIAQTRPQRTVFEGRVVFEH